MSNNLRRRIDRLESAPGVGLATIVIRGGLPDADPFDYADLGKTILVRSEGESEEEFRRRAETEAHAAGQHFITFGGLPNAG